MSADLKIEKGTRLLTKDGRRTGNAVVLRVNTNGEEVHYYCQTDFGNTLTLNLSELLEEFHIGEVCDPHQRKTDQMVLLHWGTLV